jgi:DNA-binding XRE family transcriptional regulator
MPVVMTEKQKQASRARAREWRTFRQTHLFTQSALADQLQCSRRTVVSVEAGELISPHYSLLARFRDLVRKLGKAA